LVVVGLIDVVRLVDHDAASVRINIDGNLNQPTQRVADRSPPLRTHYKCQETATAGTEQFAAGGSRGYRGLIDFVNPGVRDASTTTPISISCRPSPITGGVARFPMPSFRCRRCVSVNLCTPAPPVYPLISGVEKRGVA
jgi:hypothetical protein